MYGRNIMDKLYKKYKELGKCVRCGNERDIGKTRCSTCHKAHLAYQEKSKNKAIANGICRYCLINPKEDTKSMCASCLYKHGKKQKQNYQNLRQACLNGYGNKCACCGQNNHKYLQLDHVDNDGAQHRKELFNNNHRKGSIYPWAFKNNFPDNLQLLCANCHQAKTLHGGCTEDDHPLIVK
jgi:hypothetical protein